MSKKPIDPGQRTSPKQDEPSELRRELENAKDQAEWAWLARHAERDGVIRVSPGVDLVDIALAIARDDASTVAAWIAAGTIGKPTRAELDAWNARPDRKFLSLVVQPYVLVQEIVH